MNELSIYAKHTGWDHPLVTRPSWEATIRNKKAEKKLDLKYRNRSLGNTKGSPK